VSLFSSPNKPIIPPPEDSSVKEVFSYYGLCMYNAQILEQELINLTVGLVAIDATVLSKGDFDKFFNEAGSKTIGQLIFDLKKRIKFSMEIKESLIKAKDDRNFVAHDFFKSHDINFGANLGREKMIKELIFYTSEFINVTSQVEVITDKVFRKLGITEEIVQREIEKMEAEVRAIDEVS